MHLSIASAFPANVIRLKVSVGYNDMNSCAVMAFMYIVSGKLSNVPRVFVDANPYRLM